MKEVFGIAILLLLAVSCSRPGPQQAREAIVRDSATPATEGSIIAKRKSATESLSDLIHRVQRYRGEGQPSGGINTAFSYAVDDLDYALMGSDNSSAESWHRDDGIDVLTGQWYAIKAGSKLSHKDFPNSEGTGDRTESAYMSVPLPQYRRSPEEVVWHYLRVTELRAEGVPVEQRIHIMDSERRVLFSKY